VDFCTESTIIKLDDQWLITGDPTEGALQIAVEKLEFKKNGWQVSIVVPFESENQLMAVQAKNGSKKLHSC